MIDTMSFLTSKLKNTRNSQGRTASQHCAEPVDAVVFLVDMDSSFAQRAVPTCFGSVKRSLVIHLHHSIIVTWTMKMMHLSFCARFSAILLPMCCIQGGYLMKRRTKTFLLRILEVALKVVLISRWVIWIQTIHQWRRPNLREERLVDRFFVGDAVPLARGATTTLASWDFRYRNNAAIDVFHVYYY